MPTYLSTVIKHRRCNSSCHTCSQRLLSPAMMYLRAIVLALVAITATAFAPLKLQSRISSAANLAVGEIAPDFELESTTTNKPVKLSSFKGKKPVVVVST